jgi:fatty acid/phospholipid biosynthesis enzyme
MAIALDAMGGDLAAAASTGPCAPAAAALPLESTLEQVEERVDYEEVGGAPLFCIRGPGTGAHGHWSARALLDALLPADALCAEAIQD